MKKLKNLAHMWMNAINLAVLQNMMLLNLWLAMTETGISDLDYHPSYTKVIISFSKEQFSEQNSWGNHTRNLSCDTDGLF